MPSDLDFISRPNPVEPSALSNGDLAAHQLNRSAHEQLRPFLSNSTLLPHRRDATLEITKSARRPNHTSGLPIADVLNKDGDTELTPPRPDQTFYTLPKLPVKRGAKRNRVPPVLQGLHEPPPTARILPSISAEETQVLLPSTRSTRNILNDTSFTEKEFSSFSSAAEPVTAEPKRAEDKTSDKRLVQRNKWTEQETEDLLRGVAQFGIGSWKKILMHADYSFNKRTAVDLKDRFRVCKPNAYGKPRTKKAQQEAAALVSAGLQSKGLSKSGGLPKGSRFLGVAKDSNDDSAQGVEGHDAMWRVNRRKRRKFSQEEDDALLRGYNEHGGSWIYIQKDPVFQASGRTPTDLRDRFRTKYPDKYAGSGLQPRPAVFPKPLPRSGPAGDSQAETATPKDASQESSMPTVPTSAPPSWQGPGVPGLAHRHHVLPLPRLQDDYVPGFGFRDEEDDGEGPIVLDRSIVDWANSNMPSSRSLPQTENTVLPGIDPLITLKLPKPGVF